MIDAAAHARLTRAAPARTLQVGELRVSYVPDGVVPLNARGWLPDTTDAFWAEHAAYLRDGQTLVASIGALLVEHGERALLIDAGFGPQTVPPQPGEPHGAINGGALLANLAQIGRQPSDIEAVAVTHLHVDHIGWLGQETDDGRSPFADASIYISESEWSQPELAISHGTGQEMLDALASQVRPVFGGDEIFPGVRVSAMPGHTAGHTGYVLASGGQKLIAFGDALHSPVQVGHPELSSAVDHDPTQAAQLRRRLVAELTEPDTFGFGVHFADAQFGRITKDDDGLTWRPASPSGS